MGGDRDNTIFQLALRFVGQTDRPVFLTGKAGTGKTTFLKYIRDHSLKKMAITAPTGVAAINAGGVTLHSFFQLPFAPYIPVRQKGWGNSGSPAGQFQQGPAFSDPDSLLANIRFTTSKRELLQELELLVIDEISMVRADTLDAIDTILRHFRRQPLAPFGGLQVLLIGDLYQLPPVALREEWGLLQDHYHSPFFFDATVIRESPPIYLELEKIYRQNEADFIHILNNIRNNQATTEDLRQLHAYYDPDFTPPRDGNYITLTSHNVKADDINREELRRLPGQLYTFEASVTGEFSDKAFPAEKTLYLKEGAQIMLIKNDKGDTRRYYNGKIGTIRALTDEQINILFPGEPDELILEKETWRNIRYTYDHDKDKIEEEELGSFSQYPIRLAWAITIHKSQGLTFEKAIIDAGAAFAPGQVYVALSRLTNIGGMVLRSRILPGTIHTDQRVIGYIERRLAEGDPAGHLREGQVDYISRSLLRTCSWSKILDCFQSNYEEYPNRKLAAKSEAMELGKKWLDLAIDRQETALKFSRQISQLLGAAAADGYRQLHQRMDAASAWFIKSLDEDFLEPLQEHIREIRVKTKTKKYSATLKDIQTLLVRKKQQITEALQLISFLENGMDEGNGYPPGFMSDIEVPPTEIPSSAGLKTSPPPASAGKPKKGDSHRISLDLYLEGTPVAEIAARRGLVVSTVESHLASFILTGEIDVKELVPEDKIATIIRVIEELNGPALGPIKSKLGDGFSFGEIRAVMNHLQVTGKQQA